MLTEYTAPGESVEVGDDESIYSLLTGRIARTGEDTVIAERKTAPGQWTKVTTGEFHKDVIAAAKGLIAFGIAKGDAVTIFSATRYEWGVLDSHWPQSARSMCRSTTLIPQRKPSASSTIRM